MKRKCIAAAFIALGLLLLSGCFVKTVDEMYALPQHSDEYYHLQQAIDAVMTGGASYCAPVSGVNQQSVQLADLDGDGEDEAVVFLKRDEVKPLSAYIFDKVGETYENIAVIEGSGAAFESADYVELDDKPGSEIIIGRRLSDQVLQAMSAYTLVDGRIVELMSANYTEYTVADLDNDGRKDIFVLHFDGETQKGVVELYRYKDGQLEREPEVGMSDGAGSAKRMISGYMAHDVPAVFVASEYGTDSIITDVFAFRGDSFQNITSSDAGTSVQTVRSYYVYANDIDSDGLIELPELVELPRIDDSAGTYSIIRWYNLGMNGEKRVKLTTYHSFASGWYLTIPDEWDEQITISRSEETSGVRGLVFSEWDAKTRRATPIFTIYAFSGEDRNITAPQSGRFILSEKGDVTYAAELGVSAWAKTLDEQTLKRMFNYIRIDWNSGET